MLTREQSLGRRSRRNAPRTLIALVILAGACAADNSAPLRPLATGTNADVTTRVADAYRELWPLIAVDEQQARLPALLEDPLVPVRVFAVERVAVLLRDGNADADLQLLLLDRLGDEQPVVRGAAAALLPEIHVDAGAAAVAAALVAESDEAVAILELLFFEDRPNEHAIEPVLHCLAHGPVAPAARAAVALLDHVEVDPGAQSAMLRAARRGLRRSNAPALHTLRACLGDSDDRQQAVAVLDGSDSELAEAVARGLAMAGSTDALLRRAQNPMLYPWAVRALLRRGDRASLEALLDLRPPTPDLAGTRDGAAMAMAASLGTTDVLRTDDYVKGGSNAALRLALLQAAWGGTMDRTGSERKALARRIVPLLLDAARPTEALQLLESFDAAITEEDLLDLKFTSAIRAAAWSAAADVRPDSEAWMAQWRLLREDDGQAANALFQQITLRFADTLSAAQRRELGLPEPETVEADDGDEGNS